jgi:tyrosyl-tRNA synthetase
MKLSGELKARGFINQFSGESLENILDGEKRTFYLGVDPTADSIHIGNLTVYMMMRHIADAGHKIILLVGGGTALLGDPRDTQERALSDEVDVIKRTEKLKKQVSGLLDTEVEMVNNADWLTKLGLIDFMREIGKLLTINQMIKKEIIAKRLADESPISYTEFAYAPLQGYDFLYLYQKYNCTVQVGGSDQWGNMMTGVEIIKKKIGGEAFVLTAPLIVDKASGRKFGKSEGNAVWLNPDMTSPYTFYQFWLNVSDEDVIERLKIYTLLGLSEIAELEKKTQEAPQERTAQKTLAYEVTKFVHGEKATTGVRSVSEVLFGGKDIDELNEAEIEMLKMEAPTTQVNAGISIVDALISSKLVKSKTEARGMIDQGAVSVSGVKILDVDFALTAENFVNDIVLLRKGKKSLSVLVLA